MFCVVKCDTLKVYNLQRKGKVFERMNVNKKIASVALVSVLLASALTVYAIIYFSRTLSHNFSVIGIQGELLVPTFGGYIGKVIASGLTDGKVALVIYKENFYNIWLNVSTYSDAVGLNLTISGQTWKAYYIGGSNPMTDPAQPYFEPVGSSFSFVNGTSQVVDKARMMWKYPQTDTSGSSKPGPPEYCLVLTFNFDTELVLVPGNYSSQMKFQMGFV
jgi:hypothetical protein